MMKLFRKNSLWIQRSFALFVILISIYLVSAQLYSSKLRYIPGNPGGLSDLLKSSHYIDVPLDENEQAMFRGGSVVKRLYVHKNIKFILIRIDSGGDRKMLHNPRTCLMASGWRTTGETQKSGPDPVYTGLDLKNRNNGRDAACLFWYELGENRHSSHIGFNLDYILRKLTFSDSAAPQSLVLLQTFGYPEGGLSELVDIAEMLQKTHDQSNKSS